MDDLDERDERLLRRTFGLAVGAGRQGNGPFGAILARGASVLLEGENTERESGADPTCHAEMNVLRRAALEFTREELADCTIYCSTEPCAMCAGAIVCVGVGRVVFGAPAETYADLVDGGLVLSCRKVFDAFRGEPSVAVVGPALQEEAVVVYRSELR